MNFKNHRKKSIFVILIILFTFSLNLNYLWLGLNRYNEAEELLHTSRVESHDDIIWLDNPTFEDPIEPIWFSSSSGDLTDVNTSTSSGQANFEVLGEERNFSNVSDIPQAIDWIEFNNSYFIAPDGISEINENGCEASHEFQEITDQSRNRPSVHWRRNITMPVDMSDYIITSAILTAEVNGSADTNVETPVDDLSFDGAGYFATYYDYARFYVKVSNLDYENLYEVAYYQTVTLGQGDQTRQGTGTIDYLNDTLMTVIDNDILIFYLTKALEKDPNRLGITLGIDIYCEDNYNQADRDTFYSLLLKSCNLTFTYEKKIDQLTTLSWNQVGKTINGSNVEITEANLNFIYKIGEDWSDSLSPNSEIRILLNNRTHSETIKLSSATTSFQNAKLGGFDLLEITPPYENISLTIRVVLGDTFSLDRIMVISLDNVYLEISYTETFPDPTPIPEPVIFRYLLIIASIAALCIGGYIIAYQKILKYPKPVRKVRKYRRTLNSETIPSTEITNRNEAFNKIYKKELSNTSRLLRGKSTEPSGIQPQKMKLESNISKGGTS